MGKHREREKIKIVVPFRFYPTHIRKFQRNSKKIQKPKKYHYEFISIQNSWKKMRKIEKKIIFSFRSVPTRRVIENSKKIAKKSKKFKITNAASLKAKIGTKRPRKRENKNYRFVSFLPDA